MTYLSVSMQLLFELRPSMLSPPVGVRAGCLVCVHRTGYPKIIGQPNIEDAYQH